MEIKDLLGYLGINEDVKTLDEFKTKFEPEFVRAKNITEDSDIIKPIIGKIYGTLENDVKKFAKSFEVEVDFDSEDYKGLKKVNDKLKFVVGKYDEKVKSTITELEKKAGQGNDDKVRELEEKLSRATSKMNDYKGLVETTKTAFEDYQKTAAQQLKDKTLNVHKKEIFSTAKFIPEANDFTKKGFMQEFSEKYVIDLDETEAAIILTKDGKRIANDKVHGTFKTPADVLQEELVKANLYPVNPNGGKPAPRPVAGQQQQQVVKVRTAATPLNL